jgi:hypothetical protein
MRMTTTSPGANARAASRPLPTTRRASSPGVMSRWKTKSRSMGRLTPVTTATSSAPRATFRPARAQLPLAMSTKTTAGVDPTASVTRR